MATDPNSQTTSRALPVTYLLRDPKTAELFCDPHGHNYCEWSKDPAFAHRFSTLERAMGGAKIFLQIHNRPLEVLTFADAVNEFDASNLRSPDSWTWEETSA